MKVYVVRHGETDMGKNRLIANEIEPLNSTGIMQAKGLHEQLQKLKINRVYVSPIQRAKDTLTYFDIPEVPVQIEPRLKERDMGIYEGVPFVDLDWESFWNYNSAKQYPDCESMADTFGRVIDLLDEIAELNQNVLLVTHGGISRAIYWYFNGVPEDGHSSNINANCKIYEYDLTTETNQINQCKYIGVHHV